MNCDYIYLDNTNGRKSPCPHQCYQTESVCVFHSPNILRKAADFKESLKTLISKFASAPESQIYDFKGFIFPSQDAFLISVNLANSPVGAAGF
jgi:hypothetical protein